MSGSKLRSKLGDIDLRKLYCEDNLSLEAIADKFNMSVGAVNSAMYFRGIPTRPHSEAMQLAVKRGDFRTEKFRSKMSQILTGKTRPPLSEGHRAKLSIALTGFQHPSEFRKNCSEAQKRVWQDPKYVAKRIKANQLKPNLSEQFLISFFERNNLSFKYVGDGQVVLGGKCPDFINTDGKKQLIELFGTYWHPLFDIARRTEHYRQYGFSTLVIWEDELEDTKRLLKKVKRFQARAIFG